jgi:CelD/BcsL family acetyltransferase involved in cellulose biosynthesis
VQLELQRAIPDDSRLQKAWNELVGHMDHPEVFHTYEWARAASHAYGKSLQPWLLLAHAGSELAGVACLAIDSQNRASFLNGTTADYCDLVSRPEDRTQLVEMVFAELRRSGVEDVALANLPEDSPTVTALSDVVSSIGYHFSSRTGYFCPRLSLGSAEQRKRLKDEIRKKKSYRYGMNALGRQGRVTLTHLRTWDEIKPALPEFYVAHVARFLSKDRLSNIARMERRVFLSELARLLSQSGWLALTQLRVNHVPIAWNYGFSFNGGWFYYQPTFDTKFEKYSPGVCLLSSMIVEACDSPSWLTFDLGLGAEGYKERFALGAPRRTLYVSLSRSGARHFREVARYQVAQMLKQSPRMEISVRNAIERIRAIRAGGANSQFVSSRQLLAKALSSWKENSFRDSPEPAQLDSSVPNSDHLVPIDFRLLAEAVMAREGDAEFQPQESRGA